MAGTQLGKAYVQIIPSAKGIKSNIEKEMGNGSDTGASFGSNLCSTIKNVIVAAGIGKALSASINEGAALEQSIGGVETLFKDNADTVIKYANQAFQTAGVSANDYMEQVTSFSASLLQSLGGDTAAAAESANQAMMDMSDNSNKFGTDMQAIQNAYQGFAKQNYTMLDNLKLGYGGTKEEMQRLLADAQKLTGVKYDINNLNDVYSAIHVIQENLGVTGTTALEASTTFSGSFASMKASAQNLLATISLGDKATMSVSDAMWNLSNSAWTFLENLVPMVGNVLNSLPDLLDGVSSIVVRGINVISNNADQIVGQGAEFVTRLVSGIVTNIPYLVEAAWNLVTSFGSALLNTDWSEVAENLISSLKSGLDIAAGEILGTDGDIIGSLCSAISLNLPTLLEKGVEIVTTIVEGILQNLPTLITTAWSFSASFINGLLSYLPSVLEAGVQLVLNLVSGIISNLPQIVSAAATAIINFVTSIGANLPQILQSGIEIIGKLAAGLIKAIPDLVGKIPEIISSIKEAFTSVDWGELGTNIVKGIAKGLSNAVGTIIEAAKEVASNALNAAKDFLGIESPSKVFKNEVGKMIDEGLALGILDNSGVVSSAAESLKSAVETPFDNQLAYDLSANYHTIADSVSRGSASGVWSSTNGRIMEVMRNMADALQQMSERPIYTEMYVNGQHFARATARDMNNQIERNVRLQNMMLGARA